MGALELLESRGFRVSIHGGRLAVAPAKAIDDALRKLIRENKAAIIESMRLRGSLEFNADLLPSETDEATLLVENLSTSAEGAIFAGLLDFASLCAKLNGDERILLMERAAIVEYDGGLSREEAEALAVQDWTKGYRVQMCRNHIIRSCSFADNSG